MKKLLVLMMCMLIITGCSKVNNEVKDDEKDFNYKEVMKENDYIVVDVRNKDEYDELHVRNAINIPLDTIDEKINLDKNKFIFVYCKSGKRSSQAFDKLQSLGYTVFDLGGINTIDLDKVSTENMKVKKLVDKLSETDGICADALEEFYRDSKYIYSWSCLKNSSMVVIYNDDYEETISDALKYGNITIKTLDKYKIKYIKQKI